MSNLNRWTEGFIIELKENDEKKRCMIRRVRKDEITLANLEGGKPTVVKTELMDELYDNKNVVFLAENRHNGEIVFSDLSEIDQRETCRRFRYVKKFHESGVEKRSKHRLNPIIDEVAKEIDDKTPPSWNTLNRWLNAYKVAGLKLKGLYSKIASRGSIDPKIDDRVVSIIEKSRIRFYKKDQPKVSTAVHEVEGKILKHNLNSLDDPIDMPSYMTIKNRLLDVPYHEKVKGRQGNNRARYEFRGKTGKPETFEILERVEADHTQLNIHLLHDDYKTLLGRPYLTVLIDHYSSMVLGFQISFENPSYASAAMAIKNAILPKGDMLDKYQIEGEWPAHGVMQTLVADNGSEFLGENLEIAFGELGGVIQYCPVRSGNYKGKVERFFRTVETCLLDRLPGVTKGVGKGSDEYVAQQHAKITLSEFKQMFLTWLVGVYHRTPVGEAVESSLDIWHRSEREFPVPCEDSKRTETALMASASRDLRRTGINIFTLFYHSEILMDMYRRDGKVNIPIKYDPFNIGYIYALDGVNNVYIKVPCTNFEYADGLSVYTHDKIKGSLKEKQKGYQRDLDLQQSKVKLAEFIDNSHESNVKRKSQKTTSKLARHENMGVEINVGDENVVPIKLDVSVDFDDLDLEGWGVE